MNILTTAGIIFVLILSYIAYNWWRAEKLKKKLKSQGWVID